MKNKYKLHLLLLFCCISFTGMLSAQTLRVQGYVSSLYLSDCSDCSSSADPRIKARISTQSQPWSSEYKNERDNVGCDGGLSTNPGVYDVTGTPIGDTWWVDVRGFESDGFVCSGDDGQCDSYGSPATGISGTILSSWAPSCGGGWNQYDASRTCTSGGTQTYTCQSQLRYHFDASSLTNANAGGTIGLSVTSDASICNGDNPSIINGNSLLNDRYAARDWEVNINGGGFVSLGSNGQNYDPGVLSTGTYVYRRRLSYCTDFSGGTTSVYSNSVTIVVNPIKSTAFNYASASYCQNGSDPTPTVTTSGGTFTSSPAGLSINPSTGVIDVSASTAGSYTVTYTQSSPCPAAPTSHTVTINATGNSNFNYANSSYCRNGIDPLPAVTVLGGTFSASPAGLSFSTSTGLIDVSASTAGSYVVTYNSGGLCPTTTTDNVTIVNADNASFAYGASSYCTNGSNPSPTISGLAGGTFSAPGSLFINSSSGLINVASSTPGGPYTVTYTTNGACPNTSTQAVTILPAGVSTFNYSTTSYCQNGSDPTPTTTVLGGTYSSSPAGLSINTATGAIDVSASTPNTYTVSYNSGGTCPTTTSHTVTITATDNASFSYGSASYCKNNGTDPSPTVTGLAGGSFSATPGLVLNSSTGQIDLNASTAGGPYTVTYLTNGPCPNSSTTSVTILPAGVSSFNYSTSAYCQNGIDPTPTTTVLGGSYSSSPAGLSINGSTGTIDVSASLANTYTVTYNSGGTCATSTNHTVTITATDDASFNFSAANYCQNAGTNPVASVGGLSGGTFSATAGLAINASTGEIDLLSSTVGGPYTITYLTNGPCPNSSTQSVSILPAGNSTFSFSQATYCKNATNPTPSITVPGGTFTATAGLAINASTGQIDLASSLAGGPYTVTYTSTAPCATQSTFVVNITPADDASFSYVTNSYCTNGTNPLPNITGLAGGSFTAQSGLFINNTTGEINLASSTPGGPYLVTYTTLGACPSSANFAVSITGADNPAFSFTQASYCQNAGTNPVASVSGLPGGTFTSSPAGLAIDGSTGEIDLLSSTVGGPYTVTYTTAGACSATQSHTVTITAADNSTFAFTDPTICINGTNPTPVITGLSGGVFSSSPAGLSINASSGLIDLSTSTVNQPFTVTYTTLGACPTSSTQSVILLPAPVVSFSGLDPQYCISAGTVNLAGSPAGGSFSGLGIIGNTFSPTLTVAGTHVITYSYTDGNACSNTATQSVTINGLPFVSLSGLANSYCTDNTTPVALSILPASGGTLSGPGVSGSSFTPSNAGIGFKTVTYSYTDVNGCTNTATQNTVVNALPVVGISGLAGAYCVSSAPANLTGIPNGGTFTGTGISGNTFDPGVAGDGTFTITYSYTDGNTCSNSTTQNVTVNDLPAVAISNLGSAYCEDASPINLIASPPGGSFTGIGVSNNQLFPSIVNGNQTLVTYTYSDGNNCSNTTSQLVTINDLPTVSFTGLNPEYCVSAPAVTLTGNPVGGTFSGAGISGNSFDPATAGTGSHVITFSYTDGNTCSNSTTQTVVVNTLPTVAISNVLSAYCVSVTNVPLTGIPAGGTFSGIGVSGNTFNPATAGIGSHTITYTYSDGNGCSNSTSQVVAVNGLPTLTISGLAPAYCVDASSVNIGGSPVGGTFSGSGMSGSTFNPALAGAGTFNITYAYTDGNGCSNTTTQGVVVNPLPVVAFSGLNSSYCIGNFSAQPLVGVPVGGTFSGAGISGTNFTPSTAGVGTHVITYAYTDVNSCSNSVSQTVTVYDFPQVAITNLAAQYCISAGVQTLSGLPSGGVFSGAGVTGVSFDPAAAGVGIHSITYTFSDVNGCTNSATQQVQVYAQPTVSISGLGSTYCSNAASVTFTGTPSGGTFSGPGVSGNTFFPNIAGPGTHTVTYVYNDGNGCGNTATQQVTVTPAPNPVITGLASSYCISANPVALSVSPSGGTFSGPGMSGNTFTPQTAGAGTHTITYTVTSGGCTGTTSVQVVVNALPNVGFAGLLNAYCTTSPDVQMTAFPQGGSFTGTGVSGNIFSPSQAGPGTFTVNYSFTDGNLCSNSYSQFVTVNPAPVVSFTGLGSAEFCEDANPITLTGTPAGGTFSGPGISGDNFNPTFAGAGTYTITYQYTTNNGCSGTSTQQVTVNATPSVQITGLSSSYCVNSAPVNLTGNPSGGTFSGAGVVSNTFTPANTNMGQNVITYTYTDGNSCAGSTQTLVTVTPLDNATFFYNQSSFCQTGLTTPTPTITGTPGGTFTSSPAGLSINPVTGAINLGASTAGNYTITYATNGICSASQTFSVSVTNGANATFNYSSSQFCNNLTNPQPNITGDFGGSFSGSNGIVVNALTGEINLSASAVGTFTVTYTVGGSCPGSTTQTVTISQSDNAAFTYPLYTYCQSSSLTPTPTITGNLGGVFSGSNGLSISPVNGSINLLASQQGVNTVTYTTNGVCPASYTQNIFINNGPVADITANGATNFCFGGSVLLDAGPGYFDYQWNTGVNTQIISASASQNYSVVVTDSSGCSSSDTISVLVIQDPNASFTFNTFSLTANFSNLSDNGQSYLWIFGDNQPNSTEPNPVHTYGDDGTYMVTLVVTNLCGSDSITIPVTVMKLGLNEQPVVSSLNLYPNPTTGNITVTFDVANNQDVNITLMDVTGRVIQSEILRNYNGKFTKQYNFEPLDRGVYLYSIRTENGVITKRIVLN